MSNNISAQNDIYSNPFVDFGNNFSASTVRTINVNSTKIANLINLLDVEEDSQDIGSALSGAAIGASFSGSLKLLSDASSANLYRNGGSWIDGVKNMKTDYCDSVFEYAKNNKGNIFEKFQDYKSASEAMGDLNKSSRALAGYGPVNRLKKMGNGFLNIFRKDKKAFQPKAKTDAQNAIKTFKEALTSTDDKLIEIAKDKKEGTGFIKKIWNKLTGQSSKTIISNIDDATGLTQASIDTLKGKKLSSYLKSVNTGAFSPMSLIMSVGVGIISEIGNIFSAFSIDTSSGIKQIGKSAALIGSDFVSYAAGEYVGGAVGLALGSFLGPIGAAAGSFIGGMVGGSVASWAARKFISDPLFGESEAEIAQKNQKNTQIEQIATSQEDIEQLLQTASSVLNEEIKTNGNTQKAQEIQLLITSIQNDIKSQTNVIVNPFAQYNA